MTKAMTTKRRTVAGGLLAAPALLFGAGAPAAGRRPGRRSPTVRPVNSSRAPAGGSTWVLASGSELQPPPPPGEAAAGRSWPSCGPCRPARHGRPGRGRLLGRRGARLPLERARRWPGCSRPLAVRGLPRAGPAQRGHPRRHGRRLGRQVRATTAPGRARPIPPSPRPCPSPPSPSYPAEHAAAAGAAAAVLAHLFPDGAPELAALAEEAGRSRVLAGAPLPQRRPRRPGAGPGGGGAGDRVGAAATAQTPSGPGASRRGRGCGGGRRPSRRWGRGGPGPWPPATGCAPARRRRPTPSSGRPSWPR